MDSCDHGISFITDPTPKIFTVVVQSGRLSTEKLEMGQLCGDILDLVCTTAIVWNMKWRKKKKNNEKKKIQDEMIIIHEI